MYELVAQIDSFSPLWGDFYEIMTNSTPSEIKQYLLDNCEIKHEIEEDVFDDVILQDPEYIITYRDIMCETVSLYYL